MELLRHIYLKYITTKSVTSKTLTDRKTLERKDTSGLLTNNIKVDSISASASRSKLFLTRSLVRMDTILSGHLKKTCLGYSLYPKRTTTSCQTCLNYAGCLEMQWLLQAWHIE